MPLWMMFLICDGREGEGKEGLTGKFKMEQKQA